MPRSNNQNGPNMRIEDFSCNICSKGWGHPPLRTMNIPNLCCPPCGHVFHIRCAITQAFCPKCYVPYRRSELVAFFHLFREPTDGEDYIEGEYDMDEIPSDEVGRHHFALAGILFGVAMFLYWCTLIVIQEQIEEESTDEAEGYAILERTLAVLICMACLPAILYDIINP